MTKVVSGGPRPTGFDPSRNLSTSGVGEEGQEVLERHRSRDDGTEPFKWVKLRGDETVAQAKDGNGWVSEERRCATRLRSTARSGKQRTRRRGPSRHTYDVPEFATVCCQFFV